MGSARVLLVEDDRGVRESLARALQFEGYDITTASDGGSGLELARSVDPDAVILDVMMPVLSGLDVARKLRAEGSDVPILMLTARHEVPDRVDGLDAGADDYLVKPFALDELLARIRALLRRSGPTEAADILRLNDLEIDPAGRRVTRDGHEIPLTRTEFDLLELLVFNAGTVLTREIILERIWGFDFTTTSNSLDVYIGYLRRKTEQGGRSRLIHTVRGVGFVARER
ncbi:MAG TPA: response regulator transcription factor [Acidimicrobiia bacterium]|nr:response regulator transcription factor [Acidimicrobiia bacterium]